MIAGRSASGLLACALRLAGLLALVLSICGCVATPDADQIRLCRIAAVALVDRDATIRIRSESPIEAGRDAVGVRLDYRVTALEGQGRDGFAECRFAAGPQESALAGLFSVRTDAGPLTPIGLYFLQRFWLNAPESNSADPQPITFWAGAPDLPLPLAHGLQNLLSALPGMAVYGLLAAAYSLVYGLAGRINLAFGQMAAIGGAASLTGLAFMAHPTVGLMVAVAAVAALWSGTMHGVAIARWVFLPLGRATGQHGLVATIGLALVLNEYIRIAQGSNPPWITPLSASPLGVARSDQFVVTVTPLAMTLTAAFALGAGTILVLMTHSQFGRNWRAIADDAKAAALMGVDPVRMFATTFALASALAGISGAVTVLVYGSFGNAYGTVLGLKALLAAILGGIGSVPGAFLGGIAISVMEATWAAFFPVEYRDLALFVILAAALVARPGGFFGFRDIAPRRV